MLFVTRPRKLVWKTFEIILLYYLTQVLDFPTRIIKNGTLIGTIFVDTAIYDKIQVKPYINLFIRIRLFSIPEIHQSGYRTCHYNNNMHGAEWVLTINTK